MKDYCVIFDTNILNENKLKLNEINEKLKVVSDIYVPEMVIEEIKSQKARTITDDYSRIETIIKRNENLFKYKEDFKLSDVLIESEHHIEKWFNNNYDKIIKYSGITMKDILNRLKYKIAPFINEPGSSDKGFKDTIIWMSILKNKDIQNYKQIFFVTHDKAGFTKRREDLLAEYEQRCNVPLTICSNIEELFNNLGIVKLEKTNLLSEDDLNDAFKVDDISNLKEELNTCISNILYNTYEDEWGNDYCSDNFNIS